MIEEGKIISWIDEELEFMLPIAERMSNSTLFLLFFPWDARDYLRVIKSLHTLKKIIESGMFSTI